MDIKQFVLSYYQKATDDFYIDKITKPKDATSLHVHPYFQVYYVIKGGITHYVENGNANLASGDVFILPPSVPHYISVFDENTEFYSMSFMDNFLKNTNDNKLVEDFLHYLKTVGRENLQLKLSLPNKDLSFCQTIFNKIAEEFENKNTGSEEMIRQCVFLLLSLFARIYFEQKQVSENLTFNKTSVLDCLEYIKNHLNENIPINEMAKKSTMSKSNFCKVFLSITGKTYKDYVNFCRIEKATELIKKNEKFTNICILCGYNDFSTFYRNFKKYMGISPREFKKSI